MAVRIQFRRGTAAEWAAANPTLGAGEAGYETDTAKFKLGTGNTVWNSLAYAGVNQSDIEDAVNAVIDSAPNALNTLNEIAAALNDDASFANTIIDSLSNHTSASTNIHGIANTANLVTSATLSSAIFDHNAVTTNVHGIANTGVLITSTQLSAHTEDSINVHGISNTANLVYQSQLDSAIETQNNNKAPKVDPTFTGTVVLPSTTSIGDVSATEIGYLNNVSSAIQTQLDGKASLDNAQLTGTVSLPATTSIGNVVAVEIGYLVGVTSAIQTQLNGKADSANATFTGTVSLPTNTSIGDVTAAEIGYLDNVTSSIQTQLDGKLATSVANTTYAALTGATFTGNVVLTANTSIGTVSSEEIGHLNDVTSNIQTQLNAKAPTADPTFTGTVSGVTKTHVGLGNVDNTSDVDKPISNAVQTALDAKLALAGGTMTGRVTLSADPTQALHAVTKQYVDGIEAGLKAKPAVLAATSTNVAGTYNNGTNGVGATLTAASNGSINTVAPSGVSTWVVGSGILLKNQTAKAENGRYVVTNLGSVSTPYVLTRCGLCDEASEIPGAYVFVQDGVHEGTGWVQIVADPATFVVGTDDIDVFQFSGPGSVTAGTNISVVGSQVSVVSNPTFANVVTASSGVAFSDGTQTKQGVPSITTIDARTASYTLSSLAERDTIIEISNTSATTLTIPAESAVNYPIGTTIDIIQTNTGQVTIGNAVGVTVNATPGLKLRTRWSSATLLKRASNSWIAYGDLTA
jgi:Major tropism determinant N-terminal domain